MKKKALGLTAFLLVAASGWAAPLSVLNYSVSVDGPAVYGYNDDSYHATGLGNPVAGALSGGVGDLSDGQYGMSVAGGYWAWSPYVLWDGVSPTLTFDFGSAFHFDAVTFQGMIYNQAAVYSLPGAQFSTSNDGVSFNLIQTASFSAVAGNDVTYAFTVAGDAGLQGRYLQIQLETPGRWIAISEIQFDGSAPGSGGGNSVADPASTALLCFGSFAFVGLVARRKVLGARSV